MLRVFALLFSALFLVFGILGFISFFTPNHRLFYLFYVNGATNCFHLLLGIPLLWLVFLKERNVQLYFQISGFLLGIWAILGFLYEETPIFTIFANNPLLTWFHVITAVVALILGFGSKET